MEEIEAGRWDLLEGIREELSSLKHAFLQYAEMDLSKPGDGHYKTPGIVRAHNERLERLYSPPAPAIDLHAAAIRAERNALKEKEKMNGTT